MCESFEVSATRSDFILHFEHSYSRDPQNDWDSLISVSVCVCVCVRACVRACARAYGVVWCGVCVCARARVHLPHYRNSFIAIAPPYPIPTFPSPPHPHKNNTAPPPPHSHPLHPVKKGEKKKKAGNWYVVRSKHYSCGVYTAKHFVGVISQIHTSLCFVVQTKSPEFTCGVR